MKRSKKLALALLASLVAMAIGARDRIWYEIKPLPRWWKVLLAILAGAFVTAVFIFTAGLDHLFQLLDIRYPL